MAEARGAGRTIDLDALVREQAGMAGLAASIETTARAVRTALVQITGKGQV